MVNEQQHQWAKAHRRAWGSKADLSGLIQQKSCCSSESYFKKVSSTFLLLVLVERCQDIPMRDVFGANFAKTSQQRLHRAPLICQWQRTLIIPDLGNIWEIVFFSPGCAKNKKKTKKKNHWDNSYMMGKSWSKEDINQISEENCFFCCFVVLFLLQCMWLLISKVIPHQQTTKPWTVQALPPFPYASPSFLTYWSDVPSLIKTWPLTAECAIRAACTVTGLHEGLGMWSS